MSIYRYAVMSITAALLLVACQKAPDLDGLGLDDGDGNVVFAFSAADNTRAACAECFNRLNVQVFEANGAKVFSQMKTQTSSDSNFGTMAVSLEPGGYTVVAVGHSSAKSATISSPQDVRFTASNGEKLTDTFCVTSTFDVGEDAEHYDLTMQRATAMLRLQITDADIAPEGFARLKFAYSGGSANVNPSTLEGITKSSQTETRPRSENGVYEVFTFPYMSTTGTLKVTVSALDADGKVLHERVFESINVARNHITTYTGAFFGTGGGTLTQPELGFVVSDDWAGEDIVEF